jgi:hypothetical protein
MHYTIRVPLTCTKCHATWTKSRQTVEVTGLIHCLMSNIIGSDVIRLGLGAAEFCS